MIRFHQLEPRFVIFIKRKVVSVQVVEYAELHILPGIA